MIVCGQIFDLPCPRSVHPLQREGWNRWNVPQTVIRAYPFPFIELSASVQFLRAKGDAETVIIVIADKLIDG